MTEKSPMSEGERLDMAALLRRLPLFRDVATPLLQRVAAAALPRRLAKGDALFEAGEAPRFYFVVVFGHVKKAVRSRLGEEKVIEILGPNQALGESALLLDEPYPFRAEALRDSLVLAIGKAAMDELLDTQPSFAQRMIAELSMRLHVLVSDIESQSMQTADQRLIRYLLASADGEGGRRGLTVSLPANKLTIASRLGMTPETFSRILGAVADAGLIRIRGRQLSIDDPERLHDFAL